MARRVVALGTYQTKQRNKPDEMGTSAALLNETGAVIVSFQKCENPLSRGNCFDVSIQKGDEPSSDNVCAQCTLVETTSHGTVLCGYTANASGSGARMH
jgi:hypothetical protein